MAAWKHSRQQLRLRLAWLRVFGDDARAIQRARTRLDALGWRGRGTAWQSTGSTADRDASRATGNASTRAHIAHSHGTTRPDPSADPDAGAISHTGDHGSMTILATEIQQPQYSGMSDDEIAAALNAVSATTRRAVSLADGLWMSETLVGVEVLVIAGCTSMRTANLTGSVPIVVSMRDEVNSAAARIFSRAFWADIADGIDPEEAFYAAVDRSPTGLAEMVELKKYYA